MTKKDDRFFYLARLVAKHSLHERYRIGAIVVKQSRIVSTGVNKLKTHPRQINPHTHLYGSSIHAELDASIGISRHLLRGATIYVVRILQNGENAMSRPCGSCMDILRELGIRRVVYSTTNGVEQEIL